MTARTSFATVTNVLPRNTYQPIRGPNGERLMV